MYPQFWTNRIGGIFMRYSYEYKKHCVELFYQDKWPETPEWVMDVGNFHRSIRKWVRTFEATDIDSLRHKPSNRNWSPEEKYELVSDCLAGNSITSVAIKAGINSGQLYTWVRKYKEQGYNGLVNRKKGRPGKDFQVKKKVTPAPLTKSEREELIRLRAENAYIKAEIEATKKSIALRREKFAAQLKAKKQQSSKNLEPKDSSSNRS